MQCILSSSNDPFYNLAVEEILLKNREEEFIILYTNKTSVITGKHQVPHRETDTRFLFRENIPVIRRISGGGTVFHDPGNLNFTFIRNAEQGKQIDFLKYTMPIIAFLNLHGVKAGLEGTSDIKANGFKISGNAEHVHKNRVLHHGTLLYDSSIDTLRNCIRKDMSSYKSKAVASNPSPVKNLKELLPFKNIGELKVELMNFLSVYFDNSEIHDLSSEDKLSAENMASSKYETWEWNYAYGPDYKLQKQFYFEGSLVSCTLDVRAGIIFNARIEGPPEMHDFAEKLDGEKHMPDDLLELIRTNGIDMDVFALF